MLDYYYWCFWILNLVSSEPIPASNKEQAPLWMKLHGALLPVNRAITRLFFTETGNYYYKLFIPSLSYYNVIPVIVSRLQMIQTLHRPRVNLERMCVNVSTWDLIAISLQHSLNSQSSKVHPYISWFLRVFQRQTTQKGKVVRPTLDWKFQNFANLIRVNGFWKLITALLKRNLVFIGLRFFWFAVSIRNSKSQWVSVIIFRNRISAQHTKCISPNIADTRNAFAKKLIRILPRESAIGRHNNETFAKNILWWWWDFVVTSEFHVSLHKWIDGDSVLFVLLGESSHVVIIMASSVSLLADWHRRELRCYMG